jgi:hypothetical protein
MRGRVAAVNSVFIGSSNELGGFESGVAAKFFGPSHQLLVAASEPFSSSSAQPGTGPKCAIYAA